MPKFFNKPIHLKYIQYFIKKANIISLLILPLNKFIILKTINILYYPVERLELVGMIKDKIISIKGNYLIIKNIIHAIY